MAATSYPSNRKSLEYNHKGMEINLPHLLYRIEKLLGTLIFGSPYLPPMCSLGFLQPVNKCGAFLCHCSIKYKKMDKDMA